MITEDYVSFEVARLLKGKGFNESCYTYYDYIDNTINRFDKGYHFNNTSYPWGIPYGINKAKKYVVAPTLQMAMKWLREVHKLYIEITPSSKTNEFIVDSYRIDIVTKTFDTIYVSSGYDTYEQACEAAIKYCLEHLI